MSRLVIRTRTSLFAAGFALIGGAAQAQDIDFGARGLALQAKALAGARFPATAPRIVATHDGTLGGTATTNVSNGTDTAATSRLRHSLPPGTTASELRFCYQNFRLINTGETPGANAITVKAAAEIGAASYPLFFGGASSISIQPNGEACTDPIGQEVAATTALYSRSYVSVTAGGTWPLGRYAAGNLSEGATTGSDTTAATGAMATTAQIVFGPSAVLGVSSVAAPVIGFVGDSIAAGVGETSSNGDGAGNQGFVERGLGATYAWVSSTRSSTTIADFNAAHWRRLARLRPYVSSIVAELGINDVRASVTLATLQAAAIAEWATLGANGASVYQTTITPNVSSSNGYTTLAGQTVVSAAQNTVRTGFNDWLRCGAPVNAALVAQACGAGTLGAGQKGHPLSAVIEVADRIESARNSGLWAVAASARGVSDAAISSGTTALTSASAAFTAADIGTTISIAGAGASGAVLNAVITAVPSGTQATLATSAGTTVSAAAATLGGLTADGLHPTPAGAVLMAPAIAGQAFR